MLPLPEDDWPELLVPAPVLAVPPPDPWAFDEPVFVGLVWVFEPVAVAALPVVGVLPVEEPPAVALDELPVEADADDPPEDPELAVVVEPVEVVALAEPPVVLVVGVGVGVEVGEGEGVGVGVCVFPDVGVGVGDPVHQLVCEPLLPFDPDPV